jgi:transcriptional regulator
MNGCFIQSSVMAGTAGAQDLSMYIPPAFRDDDKASLHEMIRTARLANLVTMTPEGLMATPLPLLLDETQAEHGTLYGHLARANPQWRLPVTGEALAIFMGPDAYVTPSWYATKKEHGKVVPTWNYVTLHAYGSVRFFEDPDELLGVVTRLTNSHEGNRPAPWQVSDAPGDYMRSQLKGIVGVELTITRLEGKRKLSQNRSADDQEGVIAGLTGSQHEADKAVAGLMKNTRA